MPEESPLAAVPMEALRQSSAQSRAFGIDAPLIARLDDFIIGLVLDLVNDRDYSDPFLYCLYPGSASKTARCASKAASRCRRALHGQALCSRSVYACLSSLRGVFQ